MNATMETVSVANMQYLWFSSSDVFVQSLGTSLSLLLLLPALVIVVHVFQYLSDPHGLRSYPGPTLSKFTSIWLGWIINQNRWSEAIEDAHKRYGIFVRITPDQVSIAHPEALQAIYGHSAGPLKSTFYDGFSNFKMRNLFNTRSRADHTRKRRIEAQMFSHQNIRSLEGTTSVYFHGLVRQWDTLYRNVQAAQGRIAEGQMGSIAWTVRDGYVWFDCMPWFSFWAFDTIGDLAFGAPFGMIASAKDTAQVAKSTKLGMEAIAQGRKDQEISIETEEIPAIEPFVRRLPQFRRGQKAAPKLAGMAVAAVARRLMAPIQREDMLRRLLEGVDEDGKPMGPEELSAEAWALIIAGSDTTANTSCAITYYLGRDHRVQEKLQAELDAALGGIDSEVSPYDAIKDLPYLDAVINEGLRMHSTVGCGLPRVVPAGGINILGHHFKEGTVLSTPTYVLNRDASIWGSTVLEFRPERWLEQTEEQKKQTLQAFAPFSIGPRACIGRNLALIQLHTVIATIFRRYSFVLQDDAPLPVLEGFVRKPTKCVIGMKRRNI